MTHSNKTRGNKMQVKDILLLVHQMDRDSVEQVLNAARMRRDYLVKTGLRVGDTVRFDAKSRGIQTGRVIKINPTRVKVQAGTVMWNVSPQLLTKVEDKVTA
jgi:hypothetical protein